MKSTEKSKFEGEWHFLGLTTILNAIGILKIGVLDTLICSFGHCRPKFDQKVPKSDQNIHYRNLSMHSYEFETCA